MKILMLPPYCFPEQISSSHLVDDLLDAFSKSGIEVEMIVPTPCRGIDRQTREKYKKIKTEKRYNDTVTIRRFALFAEGKNLIGRALRYVLCNWIQTYKGSRAKDVDVVYSSSTPPTQGLMCGKIAKKLSKKYGRKVPYIYFLQDVFPDSLVSAGITSKGSTIWKLGRKIEDKTYANADKVVVIGDDIKKNVLDKGCPEEKVTVIPNWIDVNEVRPVPREENKLFDELGIDRSKFIVVYAGNLGMAQGIDAFIDAAKQVENVEFLIFGQGSCKEEYAARCKDDKNVHMFPLMPRERVSEVYSMGDLCLVSCKAGLGGGAVPSKTVSIMATATPVLLNFDEGTALWRLVESNDCGLCVKAGDVNALADAVRFASEHPDKVKQMGANARVCVEKNYSKEVGTRRMIAAINELVQQAAANER